MLCKRCQLRPADPDIHTKYCEVCYREIVIDPNTDRGLPAAQMHAKWVPRLGDGIMIWKISRQRQRIADEANSDGGWHNVIRSIEEG